MNIIVFEPKKKKVTQISNIESPAITVGDFLFSLGFRDFEYVIDGSIEYKSLIDNKILVNDDCVR
jgi:hypothetical protein